MTDEDPSAFNYKIIRAPLNELLVSTGNLLERDWPSRYSHTKDGQIVLLQYVRMAVSHFRAVTFLCADVGDTAVRSPLLALSVPPINRSILEIIFSVLYLLEDLSEHTKHYFRAAWRAEQEVLDQFQKRYGGRGRSRWDTYIANRTEKQVKMEAALPITPDEKNDLNKILRWPKMRQLRGRLKNSPRTLSYLEYLDDWFYRELSTQAHGEPTGVGEMGLYFLGMDELKLISGEDRDGVELKLEAKLIEFKTTQVWIAITLILSLLSEVEVHFGYGNKPKLLFVWTIINEYSQISEEVYKERYESLFS